MATSQLRTAVGESSVTVPQGLRGKALQSHPGLQSISPAPGVHRRGGRLKLKTTAYCHAGGLSTGFGGAGKQGFRQAEEGSSVRHFIPVKGGGRGFSSSSRGGRGKRPMITVSASSSSDEMKVEKAGISKRTLKKIIPLAIMFFCILFNYTILRDTKDVLVVTAKGMGAETIPFLKTYVQLPMAVAFIWAYTEMSNRMTPEKVFYCCLAPFILFFIGFAFVLYPNQAMIHPVGFTEMLSQQLPAGFAGPIGIIQNWTYSAFYSLSELWGSVVVSLLFWGLANQVTTVDEAKQFYPLFGMFANVALVASGACVKYFSQLRGTLPPGVDPWAVSLQGLMTLVALGGAIIGGCYWYIYNTVLRDDEISGGMTGAKSKKKKPKMSMGESIKTLGANPYIRDLAVLVIAYGMAINLVEVTWKSKLKMQFPNPNEYSAFMGDFSATTGVVTLVMMIAGRYILGKWGWGVAAMITPVMTLVTSVMFFSLVLFDGFFAPAITAMGTTPLFVAVMVGAAQNVFSKSAKYSLFDPCKEMAYIPLDTETKTKGKAAIDVVAARLGKSGGSFLQQGLIVTFGSLAASTPVLVVLVMIVVVGWVRSTSSLAAQFKKMNEETTKEALEDTMALPACSAWAPPPGEKVPETMARFITYVDADGQIANMYVPYTPLPEDYYITKIFSLMKEKGELPSDDGEKGKEEDGKEEGTEQEKNTAV